MSKEETTAESIDKDDLNSYIDHLKESDVIEIPLKLYEELQHRSTWLSYLEAAGVDNWEGYDIAYDMAKEDDPEF